jgi:hypothetical protein
MGFSPIWIVHGRSLILASGLSPPEDCVARPEDEAHRQPEHYPEIICGPKRFEQRDAKEDDENR